jgi:hypothetical protein
LKVSVFTQSIYFMTRQIETQTIMGHRQQAPNHYFQYKDGNSNVSISAALTFDKLEAEALKAAANVGIKIRQLKISKNCEEEYKICVEEYKNLYCIYRDITYAIYYTYQRRYNAQAKYCHAQAEFHRAKATLIQILNLRIADDHTEIMASISTFTTQLEDLQKEVERTKIVFDRALEWERTIGKRILIYMARAEVLVSTSIRDSTSSRELIKIE